MGWGSGGVLWRTWVRKVDGRLSPGRLSTSRSVFVGASWGTALLVEPSACLGVRSLALVEAGESVGLMPRCTVSLKTAWDS